MIELKFWLQKCLPSIQEIYEELDEFDMIFEIYMERAFEPYAFCWILEKNVWISAAWLAGEDSCYNRRRRLVLPRVLAYVCIHVSAGMAIWLACILLTRPRELWLATWLPAPLMKRCVSLERLEPPLRVFDTWPM